MLIVLQALHSIEEFIFKFYEVFPPMVSLYRDAPLLARPAFIIFNVVLAALGLICFFYWVWPAKRGREQSSGPGSVGRLLTLLLIACGRS